ncbi:MAG TPA: dicarboxylate/amino acid:cation symporter [Chloroflexota bacterium]|nr:dicarboxylate/amino acid:cation symporter [Chloroflexota bacterium]
MGWWFRLNITWKLLIAMILGILVGLVFPPVKDLKWMGDIFIRLIQVVVVPLIFAALTVAMASIGDIRSFGRIAIKVIFFYMMTTIIAGFVGLLAANIFQPGAGIDRAILGTPKAPATSAPPGLADVLLNMFPTNIVDAGAKANMIQVVVFGVLFGLIMGAMGKKAQPVKDVLESLFQIMVKMVWVIMEYSPYAVFALMAWLTATTGTAALMPLIKYVLTSVVALLFQTFIVVSFFVWLIARVNPIQFYRRSADYIMVAFSTRSSAASLPVSMQVAEQKLGIRPEIVGFSLPLGAAMNQDGTVVWHPIAAMFIAQLYGIQLPIDQQINIVVLAVLIGLGGAVIPSGGLVLLAMILQGVGLPVEGISFIAGVDAIPDMCRTTLNVVDDLSGAIMVAGTEKGMLRRDILSGKRELSPDEITFTGMEQPA